MYKKLVMIMAGCCNGHRILMSVIVFCVLGMSVTPLSADRMCPVVDAQCEENRILYPPRLPKGVKVPELSLSLFRDTVTGFNLHINLRNFKMEPAYHAREQHEGLLHGYADLFVNGDRIHCLYGPYEHLLKHHLVSGENEIKVILSRHDGRYWSANGKFLVATLKINTWLDDPVISSTSTSPLVEQGEM